MEVLADVDGDGVPEPQDRLDVTYQAGPAGARREHVGRGDGVP
jgi:hypothetical protein